MAGPVLQSLFEDALREERALKASLESRAVFVINSSGAFTTFLLAVGGFATGSASFALSSAARGLLIAAVLLFATAALLCLKVNQPTEYEETSIKGLGRLVRSAEPWGRPAIVGWRTVSFNRLQVLSRFRAVNKTKADLLKWAFAIEVVAVGFVALSVVSVLAES